MDADLCKSPVKMVSTHKRFVLKNYDFVYGGDQIKSYLKRLTTKRVKPQFLEDPVFDIYP